jgi:large subunit ribosomal protein L6
MSRIGRKPIALPAGVSLTVADRVVTVKGAKGSLTTELHPHVTLAVDGQTANVSVTDPDRKQDRALWGLFRALVANMVRGVTEGFEKKLEVHGIGYKAAASGKKITLSVGFSHPVEFPLPDGVEGKVEKNVITISGIDKQLVGDTAARIRQIRPPEPYKGKGIKYADEVVRRKAGKVVKAAE